MPHLTSGLVAFRKPTAEKVHQFVELACEACAPCAVYLLQVDGGRAVVMAVEARVGEDRESGDVSQFIDGRALGALAKHLRQPLWGGFAEGGYTNTQRAIAVDAKGKLRWRSAFDFRFPVKVEAQGLFPLQHPDENEKLYAAERAKHGYGRIGAELNCDFYHLLSIERGDPLTTVPFLAVDAKTTVKQLAAWLARYRPPKQEKLETPTELFLSFDAERPNPANDAAVVTALAVLAQRLHRVGPMQLSVDPLEGSLLIGLRGRGVADFSRIAQRQPFCDFLGDVLQAPVRIVSVRKGRVVASTGRMNAMMRLRGLGGRPLAVPDRIDWQELPRVPPAVLARFEKGLRQWAKRKASEPAQPEVIIGGGLFG